MQILHSDDSAVTLPWVCNIECKDSRAPMNGRTFRIMLLVSKSYNNRSFLPVKYWREILDDYIYWRWNRLYIEPTYDFFYG